MEKFKKSPKLPRGKLWTFSIIWDFFFECFPYLFYSFSDFFLFGFKSFYCKLLFHLKYSKPFPNEILISFETFFYSNHFLIKSISDLNPFCIETVILFYCQAQLNLQLQLQSQLWVEFSITLQYPNPPTTNPTVEVVKAPPLTVKISYLNQDCI